MVGGRIARWRGCWSIEWLGGGVSSFTVWRLVFFFFFFDELGTGTEVTSMYRFVVVRGLLILNLLPHLFLGFFSPPPLLLFSLPHCASTDIIAIGSSRRARNIHSQTDGC